MAGIYEDNISCKECGCTHFEVKNVFQIRSEAEKMNRSENEAYPGRFIENNVVLYKCTECGTTL